METNEKEIYERLTALESNLTVMQKRVEHIEELVESVREMTAEMQHMREDINKMTEQITDIEQKPAKRWETVILAVLSAFAGGLGTMMLTKLLGG